MEECTQTLQNQTRNQRVPWKRVDQQDNSLFMRLPLDLLLSVRDHLPPESSAALCLTCKAALDVFEPQDLHEDDLRRIRQQFEREMSERCFYCGQCGHLHRYSKDWRIRDRGIDDELPCEAPRVRIGLWKIGFYHFQLVMNTHLYGPGRGLPASIIESGRDGAWLAQATMAVLDGQLFLSVRYTRTIMGSVGYRLPELELAQQDQPHELKAPWSSTGSCRICLTDYAFKLTCARPPFRNITGPSGLSQIAQPAAYKIEIETYHQLGACRDAFDWMWRCFADESPSCTTRLSQILTDHPPGAIRDRWVEARAQKDEKSQGVGEASVVPTGTQ
ncbi:hypothetical protein PG984_007865 [Apiospora sp. TS-2023a]